MLKAVIFLATSYEVKKYVELIEKMEEIKTVMQSSSPDDCVSHYNIEILNLFDPELQLSNTKSIIKNKLKVLFFELKKYEVETILIL